MQASVAGFLTVATTDGRTFYINPHHVSAVEAVNGGASLHLHSGEKIPLAEKAEEILQVLHDLQGATGAPGPRLRQRLRERRRARSA